MFFNNKSQSNAAGSELFAGDDSFMTELEATDLNQIFGGGGYGGGCHKEKKHEKGSWKKSCETPRTYPECPPPVEKCPPPVVKCPPVVYCPPAPGYYS